MNIVITGVSKGIGRDLLLKLAENTNNTVIGLSRDTEALNRLQEISVKHSYNLHTHYLDLTNFTDLDLQTIFSAYETIDVLINNAGILINKPFLETTADDWKNVYETNVFGMVKLTQFLVPKLAHSPIAHIVNIGSMGGFQGSKKFTSVATYSSSKAAIACLTECLAIELKEYNIKVNCLALGSVNTDMLSLAFPAYQAPLNSDEIASFICEFATVYHKFFNGKIVPVSITAP